MSGDLQVPWSGLPDVVPPKPGNLPRWYGRAGHHEVWYLTTQHAPTGHGLWFRYTLHAPVAGSGEPEVALWGFAFGPDGVRVAAKRAWPHGEAEVARGTSIVDTPDGVLTEGRATGDLSDADGRRLSWDLSFDPEPVTTGPLPPPLERVAPSFYANPNLHVRASGTVTVDGDTLELADEPLGQSHIWGRHHAGDWSWCHLHVADGFTIEALQARPHAPVALPALPFVLLRLDGRDTRYGPAGRFRVTARSEFPLWHLTLTGGDLRIDVSLEAPPRRCVQVTYHDPDGAEAFCTNTEVGHGVVEVYRRARGRWRPTEVHDLRGRAHLEFGGRRPRPEVPVAF